MKGIVRQTYLLLGKHNNFKLSGRKLWVSEGWYYDKNLFWSIDNKKYNLLLSKDRPRNFTTPYELFVEDEHV